jgi:hypothetical protein
MLTPGYLLCDMLIQVTMDSVRFKMLLINAASSTGFPLAAGKRVRRLGVIYAVLQLFFCGMLGVF